MSTKLSDLNWAELIKIHGSALNIAVATGIKYQTIVYHLRKNKIPLSNKAIRRQNGVKLNPEIVIKKYHELNSLDQVARYFNVAESIVSKLIPAEFKSINACIKYKCDEDFFSQNTEASFYWAGFIMADGCVKLKDKKYKQLSIGLALNDINHLEKFKHSIKFEGPLFSGIYDGLGRCEVTISSDEIFNSLARFNIVPRKSLIAKFPEWLIEHPLAHHFMRGYFDGDGSIYTQDTRKNEKLTYFFSMRGTTDFLSACRAIMEKNTCVKPRIKDIRINSGHGVLEYGGNIIMQSIRDFLYRDATVYLDRKHAIFFDPKLKTYHKGLKSII